VCRVGPEGALLGVRDGFHAEADQPDDDAQHRERPGIRGSAGGHRGERGAGGQHHPERLERPAHEEPGRVDLDLVEPAVGAVLADAQHQEGAQAEPPHGDEHGQQDRERRPRPGDECDRHHAQVRDRPGQVVEALAAQQVRRHESDPVDDERERSTDREHRPATHLCAAGAAGPADEGTDEDRHQDRGGRLLGALRAPGR
jgi:hypothetical protein